MNEFEESIQLHAHSPNAWRGHADHRRVATSGMYGGWTATLLLHAIMKDAVEAGSVSALTIHYLHAITPGSVLTVRTRNVNSSRSLSVWHAEVEVEGVPGPAATATAVLARRRDSFTFLDVSMPEVPPPDALPKMHPPGTFGERSLVRPAIGSTPFNQSDTRSVAWVREISGRSLDYLQLAYLADNYPPKTWSMRAEPSPYSTITMSIYFHGTDEEVSSLGDDYVLIEAYGTRAQSSTVGAQGRIWSRSGLLLVTTEQMGWFR
ncbi:MAG: thioesterase family protein [Gammaproteobacteria bacterium]|nr:thioesterase family protein [Gammaproteobacteria bacterium]